MTSHFSKIHDWYARFERPLSSLSLVGGFVFDALTLKRVDLFWENFWVIVHLIVAALGIVVLNYFEAKKGLRVGDKLHFWLLITIQFAFGGLFSVFLVFYFRSATLASSWPFLFLLAIAFVLNESFKKHYSRLTFQTVLLFTAIFSFAIFLVPVIVHDIGITVFLVSGVVSLLAMVLFIFVLVFTSHEKYHESKRHVIISILSVFIIINALYFTNLIPPIPLSLVDAGIYHSILKNSEGGYAVTYEERSIPEKVLNFLRSYETYHRTDDEPVSVYAAVFSPANFGLNIVHVWQFKDSSGNWQTTDRIQLPIVGGRDGGFRSYSRKSVLTPGMWRVSVRTAQGQEIGRIKFMVEDVSESVQTSLEIK